MSKSTSGYYSFRIRPTKKKYTSLTTEEKKRLIKQRQEELALIAKDMSEKTKTVVSGNAVINLLIEEAAKKIKN